jgi:phosphoadenylyl-sulfate reductase (thioredoxin)
MDLQISEPTADANKDDAELLRLSRYLEDQSAEAILRWAAERFGSRVAFGTGFGVEGCVLLDLIGRHQLPIDVFTLDTGLLFPETYDLWHRLEERYGFTIRGVRPELTVEEQAAAHGPKLWERNPDRCCELRKVLPLRAALRGSQAWISAIRRDQTPDRAQATVVERDRKFGLIKVNPLLRWTSVEIWQYVKQNEVPYNPLYLRDYASIGCMPCTTPVLPGEELRAGRWRGRAKTECGLHSRSRPTPSPAPELAGS